MSKEAMATHQPQPGAAAGYALELRDLRKNFGKTEIIRGINLAVNTGERVAIIGPNGAGKSTLFNLISGRFEPSSGDVLLNGQRINGKKAFEINRLGLSRSFQITNIFPKLSVFENLRCGVLWSLGYRYTFFKFLANLHDANARADELMALIKLDKKRDVLAINLTYAEQRALEIGITIAGGANVILLDEPTAGMSRSETSRFISLIMMNVRVAAFGKLRPLWSNYLALFATGLLAFSGAAAMIEMLYHIQLDAALGSSLHFLGFDLNVMAWRTWLACSAVMLVGLALFELARRRFAVKWGDIQEVIEKEIKRREAI